MLRALTIALTLIAASVSADTVDIETYRGNVTVDTKPDIVAVFDMAALDTLEALGVEVDATIANVYLDYLEDAAAGKPRIGSLFEPDFEAINARQPDLIIAGGRSYEAVPDLAKMAPSIDMTIWEDTIGQGLDRLTAYGAIFGKELEAATLRTDLEAKMAQARALGATQGRTLILMTHGPKVSAYGANGRFGWLHQAFDLQEAVDDVETSTHGEAISFEFIRQVDPDLILVIDRAAAISDSAGGASTLDKVVFLDSGPIYIAAGGVQSLNNTLDQLLSAFTGG